MLITGNTEIMIESDINNIDDKQAVPTIINKIEDGNKGLGVSYNANKKTIHNDNGIGVRQKFDMATVSLKYVQKTAAGTEGVQALIINGPISDRIQEIATEASIATVVGTKPGKGFSEESGQKSWFSESHR